MSDASSPGEPEPSSWTENPAFACDIVGDAPGWAPGAAEIRALVCAALDRVGPHPCPAELSFSWVDNDAMQRLNAAYRGKDKPTNVLSFPALDPDALAEASSHARAGGPPLHFGDIALAGGVAAAEADAQAKAPADHARHLIVHGSLHLLGFDHIDEADAAIMEAHEVALLAARGIANPYIIHGPARKISHEVSHG